MKIKIDKIPVKKLKLPPAEAPVFGKLFTNRMFLQNYSSEKGWFDPRISVYSNISLPPSAQIFHYGQAIFEGLKAYKTRDGRVLLFRPIDNVRRFNKSAIRMQMPPVDEMDHLEAIKTLTRLEKNWIPDKFGSSLYLRPVMIAIEPTLWMPSREYLHYIIASPTGAYMLENGKSTISLYVEDSLKRAVIGGVGEAKTSGNYASGLLAHEKAIKAGYNQVLWLDAIKGNLIEEAGTMNIFFVNKNNTISTPKLNGSILDGITRNSVITLCEHLKIKVEQKEITIEKVINDIKLGEIREIFGTGTAASILPIGCLYYKYHEYIVARDTVGEMTLLLKESLNNIQYGISPDIFGWTIEV